MNISTLLVPGAGIEPALDGYKFGPVLAESPDLARRVVGHLLSMVEGQAVQIDVPEPNASGRALAESF